MSATHQGTLARESGRDRIALFHDAGYGRLSGMSILAGVLAAYGAFVILLAVAAAIVRALGSDTDLSSMDWRTAGIGAAIVVGLVLFLAYTAGGYVAGRMARRAGVWNGAAVFVVGVLLAAVVGLVVNAFDGTDAIVDELRALGVPTSGSEWAGIGSIAGIASLVAMLAGALFGGWLGERWHARLVRRALDPDIGTEAKLRADVEERNRAVERHHAEAEQRVARAEAVPSRPGYREVDSEAAATAEPQSAQQPPQSPPRPPMPPNDR